MPNIEMYSTRFCPYCMAARRLLDAKQVEYTVYDLDREPARRKEMMERSGRHTVPQIFIEGRHIGGFDDMAALDAEGGLDPLLA